MVSKENYKISQVAFKSIADAGDIESTRSKKLQNVYLLLEVRELFFEIDRDDIISAMELH
ncbi:hypothetical protein [Glaciecola sp. SC05]|uniref:hypothetical protein n=1 Tax=Glaciecola sp. SC05 TaxID=1987355 RepID=UPI003527DE25